MFPTLRTETTYGPLKQEKRSELSDETLPRELYKIQDGGPAQWNTHGESRRRYPVGVSKVPHPKSDHQEQAAQGFIHCNFKINLGYKAM